MLQELVQLQMRLLKNDFLSVHMCHFSDKENKYVTFLVRNLIRILYTKNYCKRFIFQVIN